ncbi:MAG: hypothetical protein QT00_C0002G0244 [archaeon GW2011_AR5]|nr:MAG: hypothetical protein QT00_C0002G0244 [archaeon GW2011_AR5]
MNLTKEEKFAASIIVVGFAAAMIWLGIFAFQF